MNTLFDWIDKNTVDTPTTTIIPHITVFDWVNLNLKNNQHIVISKQDIDVICEQSDAFKEYKEHKRVIDAIKNASMLFHFPTLDQPIPDDFTRLVIVDKNTNTSIPIWKYVLSVLQATGLLQDDQKFTHMDKLSSAFDG